MCHLGQPTMAATLASRPWRPPRPAGLGGRLGQPAMAATSTSRPWRLTWPTGRGGHLSQPVGWHSAMAVTSTDRPAIVYFYNLFNSRCKLFVMGLTTTWTAPCGLGVSRIEPLCSPACRKRRLMEASRALPAGAVPSVVKV